MVKKAKYQGPQPEIYYFEDNIVVKGVARLSTNAITKSDIGLPESAPDKDIFATLHVKIAPNAGIVLFTADGGADMRTLTKQYEGRILVIRVNVQGRANQDLALETFSKTPGFKDNARLCKKYTRIYISKRGSDLIINGVIKKRKGEDIIEKVVSQVFQ